MPRNGSGVYTIPTTFTAGTVAKSGEVNGNFSDVATALTGSLPRDGQAGMTGPFLAVNGSAASPGIAFGNDTDTGFIRLAGDTIGVVCGGTVVAQFSVEGFFGDAPGVIKSFGGTTAPTGYLLCDGAAVSRTTYANLFAAIGTNWGEGDGSTTFNVPDLRGRTEFGKDDMGGPAAGRLTEDGSGIDGATVGATGGSETHTLTEDQIPEIDLGETGEEPEVPLSFPYRRQATYALGGAGAVESIGQGGSTQNIGPVPAHKHTLPTIGGGEAHNNMPPSGVVLKIIKY